MAHRGRQNADEQLAMELATGKTVRDASTAAGVSERTGNRRWADAEFRKVVAKLRRDMASRAAGQLADGMTEATTALRELLGCESPAIKLGAARSIIELGTKMREAIDLDERVEALEEHLAKTEQQQPAQKEKT